MEISLYTNSQITIPYNNVVMFLLFLKNIMPRWGYFYIFLRLISHLTHLFEGIFVPFLKKKIFCIVQVFFELV